MATTYKAIATVTVGGGGAASITFSSIPATYTDLAIKLSARSDRVNVDQLFTVRFNGLSTNLSSRRLDADGSSASSSTDNTEMYAMGTGNNALANTPGSCDIYIPNYAGSTYKSVNIDGVSESNATNVSMSFGAGRWSDSAAIASIVLTPNGGQTILQFSTATLYGIKNS